MMIKWAYTASSLWRAEGNLRVVVNWYNTPLVLVEHRYIQINLFVRVEDFSGIDPPH